jgi:hypothetical protein
MARSAKVRRRGVGRGRQPRSPLALATAFGFLVASGLNAVLKPLVDRARPPEAIGLDALIGVHSG